MVGEVKDTAFTLAWEIGWIGKMVTDIGEIGRTGKGWQDDEVSIKIC